MYLVDTNVWLEDILQQQKAAEADQFLKAIPSRHLNITSFALYSISIVLVRSKKQIRLKQFLDDLFVSGDVSIVTPTIIELGSISNFSAQTQLDFDDSFQAFMAQLRNLKLVSYDSDFSSKGIAVLNPLQAIADFQKTIIKT